MGKSGGKKKKAASGEGAGKADPDDAIFLRRAHELKDQGNRRFQAKDYLGAFDIYDQALKLCPEAHPDRAVFHSNRAACLFQIKPVIYENVVTECSLALEAHPKFGKALFRRARAYEAMGNLQAALTDISFLLQQESYNQEAVELAKRVRAALGNSEGAQQDTRRPIATLHASPPDSASAPPTPGAEGGSVQNGRGPSLPARPPSKKKGRTAVDSEATLRNTAAAAGLSMPSVNDQSQTGGTNATTGQVLLYPLSSQDENRVSKSRTPRDGSAKQVSKRPLKLIFGDDIRRAEVPCNCGFGELREVVRKRFPALAAVLIKYHDTDGDLVTITSREELRLAEGAADEGGKVTGESEDVKSVATQTSAPALVRLHVVECTVEQEPPIPEDDVVCEEETFDSCSEEVMVDSLGGQSESVKIPSGGEGEQGIDRLGKPVKKEDGQLAGEEMEIDDWLFDFAQLFRTHVGIDPDGHVDLHELGMELCSEALEAAVTSENAQPLFEAAAAKFQEVAALALFNWGNVYMCAARKRMPLEEAVSKPESKELLHAAFEWAERHYKLAGVLALGQEKFESAKLKWAAAVAGGVDLKTWNSSETLSLYRFAEERMQTAAEMWEQLESQQQTSQADAAPIGKKEQAKSDAAVEDGTNAADQGAAMRSQINLFWGNVLFEHSQVEYRLGLESWKPLRDLAVEKFVAAGASTEEIDGALKNHPANVPKETENTMSSPNLLVIDTNGSGESQAAGDMVNHRGDSDKLPGVNGKEGAKSQEKVLLGDGVEMEDRDGSSDQYSVEPSVRKQTDDVIAKRDKRGGGTQNTSLDDRPGPKKAEKSYPNGS